MKLVSRADALLYAATAELPEPIMVTVQAWI